MYDTSSSSMLPSTTLGHRSSLNHAYHHLSHKNLDGLSRFDSSHYATPQVSFPSLDRFHPVQRHGRNGQPLSPANLHKFLQSSMNLSGNPRFLEGLSQSVNNSNGMLKRQVSEERMMQTMKIYHDSLSQLKKLNVSNNDRYHRV